MSGRRSRAAAASLLMMLSVTLTLAAPAEAVSGWTGPQTAVPLSKNPQGGSIAVDKAGTTYVAYAGFTIGDMVFLPNGIWMATNKTGHWVNTHVIKGLYEQPSMAIDPKGKIHLAVVRDKKSCDGGGMCQAVPAGISYATNKSGHWVVTTVSTGNQRQPVIAVASGKVSIAYDTPTKVFYATNGNGPWVNSTVDVVAVYGSLDMKLDSGRVPHLAFVRSSDLGVMHAYRDGSSFVLEGPIDGSDLTFASDAAMDFLGPVTQFPLMVVWVPGSLGSVLAPSIYLEVRDAAPAWGSDAAYPQLIDSADGPAFTVESADGTRLRVAYTSAGRGVSTVLYDMAHPELGWQLKALTTPNGQDQVLDVARTAAGKARILFARNGALMALLQN